jgi:putative molybdopterin biosynthesis protein
MLKSGLIHLAASHLRDEATGESNLAAVQKRFPPSSAVVVNLARWEQGIVVAKRNPKGIRGVDDLARRDVRLVNREPGAGSRALLDAALARLGINPKQVLGYETVAHGDFARGLASAARRRRRLHRHPRPWPGFHSAGP